MTLQEELAKLSADAIAGCLAQLRERPQGTLVIKCESTFTEDRRVSVVVKMYSRTIIAGFVSDVPIPVVGV